jgi:hypothetical protein
MLEKSLRDLGAGRSILLDSKGAVIAGNKTLEAARMDLDPKWIAVTLERLKNSGVTPHLVEGTTTARRQRGKRTHASKQAENRQDSPERQRPRGNREGHPVQTRADGERKRTASD